MQPTDKPAPCLKSIAAVLDSATAIENGIRIASAAEWMQGRTVYGGLSSAVALAAARRVIPDLPALASFQIAFAGPISGAISATARLLRRGRSAAFVEARVVGEAGDGLIATFLFLSPRESALSLDIAAPAPVPPPAADAKLRTGPPGFFACNFEFSRSCETGSDNKAHLMRWVRLVERGGLHPEMELLAIGDALPPAAFGLLPSERVPVSSLNWSGNLLRPAVAPADGWWLLETRSDLVSGGFSSQQMTIWDSTGRRAADAMQGVAVFG